jgi:hypothetical protein
VVSVADPDVLTFAAGRQVHMPREHLSRLDSLALPFARIGTASAASAQLTRPAIAVARIVAPTCVVHGKPP